LLIGGQVIQFAVIIVSDERCKIIYVTDCFHGMTGGLPVPFLSSNGMSRVLT
jgi:hypothetical protein